jgi:hypothetical protein
MSIAVEDDGDLPSGVRVRLPLKTSEWTNADFY